jgi:hypothetical protein
VGGFLAAATVAVVVLAGCGDDDGGDEVQTGEVEQVAVLEVRLGDDPVCMDFPEDQTEKVDSLPIIDCESPHSHELYAEIEYEPPEGEEASDLYPGEGALETFSEGACLREFEPFVGISFFDSELFYSWIIPSLDGWNDDEDRTILCVLGRFDSRKLEGSAKGRAM